MEVALKFAGMKFRLGANCVTMEIKTRLMVVLNVYFLAIQCA